MKRLSSDRLGVTGIALVVCGFSLFVSGWLSTGVALGQPGGTSSTALVDHDCIDVTCGTACLYTSLDCPFGQVPKLICCTNNPPAVFKSCVWESESGEQCVPHLNQYKTCSNCKGHNIPADCAACTTGGAQCTAHTCDD